MSMFGNLLEAEEAKVKEEEEKKVEEVKEEADSAEDVVPDDTESDLPAEEEESCKEYADFIDKHLLSSYISEDTTEIIESLNALKMKDTIEYSDISDIIVRMEGTDLSDVSKLAIMESLLDLYNEWIDAEGEVAEHSLLEYAGNAEKNRILRQLMVEMEKCFTQFYEEIDFVIGSLDSCLDIMKTESAKKDPSARNAALKIKPIADKVEHELTKQEAKDMTRSYAVTWEKIKKVCSSFSIKFNDVVMEDKKAFDKKLEAAANKVTKNKKFTAWLPTTDGLTEKIKEFNKCADVLKLDNPEINVEIIKMIQPIYNYAFDAMNGYIGNINYLRKKLGIEKEHTIFYKVINKIFKTKKK